jgi:putative transposase
LALGCYRAKKCGNHWIEYVNSSKYVFSTERFLPNLVEKCGKNTGSNNDGGTWYPQTCKSLNLDHQIYFLYTKMRKILLSELCSVLKIEPKDLSITFLVKRKDVMVHIKNWIKLFFICMTSR